MITIKICKECNLIHLNNKECPRCKLKIEDNK